jgi:hypothetical protein
MILAVYIGRSPIGPALYPQFLAGLQVGFAIFAVLCTIGIYFSLGRGNMRASPAGGAAKP